MAPATDETANLLTNQKTFMTKKEFRSIQQTGKLLEALSNTDGTNHELPEGYTKALIEAQDHYSMLLFSMGKYKDKIADGLWNEELEISAGSFDADTIRENKYTFGWWNDDKLIPMLTIYIENKENENEDFLAGSYYDYNSTEDIKEDVKALLKMGFVLSPKSNRFKID